MIECLDMATLDYMVVKKKACRGSGEEAPRGRGKALLWDRAWYVPERKGQHVWAQEVSAMSGDGGSH